MARPLRVEYPGAFYHVINRGNHGEDIFETPRDYKKFLEYLGKAAERFAIIVHAYCLMPNHYHLLLQTPEANLSAAIQWINVSYAGYYNRKHQRSGHLFQGRFKAFLIDADEYLLPLSRYIHLNPIRAKIATNPAKYAWSSYPAIVGKAKIPEFLRTDYFLAYFGEKTAEAIRSCRAFVEGADLQSLKSPSEQAVGGLILGNGEFVNRVKKEFLSAKEGEKEIPQLRELRPRASLERIIQAVCDEYGCREEQIRHRGSKRNMARGIAVYLARDLTGAMASDLGQFFGKISGAAITMIHNKVKRQLNRDRQLGQQLKRIKGRIFNN